jgi:dTDP-4-dehydrorhamnose 3,5-epimerase
MGNNMKPEPTPLNGSYVLEFKPFEDNRGQFTRTYCQRELQTLGHTKHIAQANISMTREKGSIRGMHLQLPPNSEIKIVRCIKGAVYDVIVDIRSKSPTFLQWFGETLTAKNRKMMYIPEGFAHGFQTLEGNSELLYFHTEFFSPEFETGLRFDDPLLAIKWPLLATDVSKRDKSHPLLNFDYRGVEL